MFYGKICKIRLSVWQQEGRRQRLHEAAARRQGREPRRDDAASACRCLPASPSPPRSAPTTTRTSGPTRKALEAADGSRRRHHREDHGHEVRRHERHAAARLRPLRRPRLDARHDGHDPEPRPERRDRAGARRPPPRTSASPGTATAASSRCTATSSWACRSARTKITSRSKSSSTASSTSSYHAGHRGHQADRRRPAGTRHPLQGARQGAHRQGIPATTRGSSSGAPPAPCSAPG